METTGNVYKIEKIRRVIQFEWEIKNFFVFEDGPEEQEYLSPEFSFYGVIWQIQMIIYPYADGMGRAAGWMLIYLIPVSLPECVTMNMAISFKTVNGEKYSELVTTHNFKREKCGLGIEEFFLWSELLERAFELLPSGTLTVICILRNSETDMQNENKLLDASSQTEGGLGVLKLQQHLREISLNGDISDVILKVKDQEFKSHRCILAARSPVFSAMMKNKMKENATGVVKIEDIDPKIFSYFLNYLYTGSIEDIQTDIVTKLYTIADKYQVEVLKENCLDHMTLNVSVENFCDILFISVQYNEEKLKETCIQYFSKHLLDIIKTCKWQSFLCENPIICNELHIKYLELIQYK